MLSRSYNESDRKAVVAFVVTGKQTNYVEPLAETLSTTGLYRENYVIEVNGLIIGFFQIDSKTNNQCIPDHLELHEVIIDSKHQSQGYGKEFLKELFPFLKEQYPEAAGVCLTVNCKNHSAINLYLRSGFADTGMIKTEGRSGPQHVMKKDLTQLD